MARVPDTLFTDFTDGGTIHASDYTREREIMRVAINDFDDKINLVIPVNAQEAIAKVPALETGLASANEQLLDKAKKHWVDVKGLGVKGDGITFDSDAINQAITNTPSGSVIYFPSGTYLLDKPIILKESITYIGDQWLTVFKQANGKNVDWMAKLPTRIDRKNYGFIFKGILFDGNKTNNTSGGGLYVGSVYTAVIEDVRVIYAPETGITIDGNATIGSNTVSVNNTYVYGCDKYGLLSSAYSSDTHINGGDYGSNKWENIYLDGPSSSVQNDATVWGSVERSGITISSAAPSCQVIGCHVEGNAQHGINGLGAHASLLMNKVYDNANLQANYGLYDGIYIDAENVSSIGNVIYSGLYANTGKHRYPISLNSNHSNCTVSGNSVRYNNNGAISTTAALVYGLKDGDIHNGMEFILSTAHPANALDGTIYYEFDTKKFTTYHSVYGWVYLTLTKKNLDAGVSYAGAGVLSVQVTFATNREDTNYAVNVTPTWNTTVWVTNVFASGFLINFGTAPSIGSNVDWSVSQI